jgi:hypothetical protein
MSLSDDVYLIDRFANVLARVSYPGFYFIVSASNGGSYLQIKFTGPCNVTGEECEWKSRKWLLSTHMTDGEIVQTAFKAVLTALEHEARERFTYRGWSIFDPHYDVEALVKLRSQGKSIKERDAGTNIS